MKNLNYTIINKPPKASEYLELRRKVGWDSVDQNVAENSLTNSLFNVSVWHEQNCIGMARVVGDGFIERDGVNFGNGMCRFVRK